MSMNTINWEKSEDIFLRWIEGKKCLNKILHIQGYHGFGKTELLLRWVRLCYENKIACPIYIDARELKNPDHFYSSILNELLKFNDSWEKDSKWPDISPFPIFFIDNADGRIKHRIDSLFFSEFHPSFKFGVVQSTTEYVRSNKQSKALIGIKDFSVDSYELPKWSPDDLYNEIEPFLKQINYNKQNLTLDILQLLWGSRIWFQITWPTIAKQLKNQDRQFSYVNYYSEIREIVRNNHYFISYLINYLSAGEYKLLKYFSKFHFDFKLGKYEQSFLVEPSTLHTIKDKLIRKGFFRSVHGRISVQPLIRMWFSHEEERINNALLERKPSYNNTHIVNKQSFFDNTVQHNDNKYLIQRIFESLNSIGTIENIDGIIDDLHLDIVNNLDANGYTQDDIPEIHYLIANSIFEVVEYSRNYTRESYIDKLIEKAIKIARQSYESAIDMDQHSIMGKSLVLLGHLCWNKMEYAEALENWKLAYLIFCNIKKKKFDSAYCLYLMAFYHQTHNEMEVAENLFRKCDKILDTLPTIYSDRLKMEIASRLSN